MWILALLACRAPAPTTSPIQTTPQVTTTTTFTDSADADLVRGLIAGDEAPEQVLHEIAWSGGWPVQAGDTWLFVATYEEPLSIAGDFNDWEPVPMNVGDGFYWAEYTIADATGVRYKFVDSERWAADPSARSYTYDENGQISYVAPPDDTFHLERWPDLTVEDLEPRHLRVYVPEGAGPWPVLYMQDGQNLFNPEAISGGWRLQDTLATRAPMLVVGIDNTGDRMDEYTHVQDDIDEGTILGGNGDAYAALLQETIRPFIEAHSPVTEKAGVMGSSLGGLISLHIVHQYPGTYDFVGSMSGTLGWGKFALGNETMAERWLDDAPPVALYIDSGGDAGEGGCEDPNGDGSFADDPDATDGYCTSVRFAEQRAQNGFTWEQDLWHWHDPGAPHSEIAWSERVFRPFDIFLDLP